MAGASKPITVSHETTTDRGTRSAKSRDGVHIPGLPHRPRLAVTRRTTGPARTVPWAWTDRRPRTTQRTWRTTSSRCWTEPSPARTRRRRCDGCTSRRPARLPRPVRSGFRPLKTRCFSGRWSWCWKPSTSRTSWTARTASGPADRRTRRWTLCGDKTMAMGGGWILDVDIRKFFDTLDHAHLRDFLKRRVRDGVLLRLIDKWLKAGVLEDGCITHPETGTPQGGVISPVLSNLFLHYVLDDWFEQEVQPRLKGQSFLIRYADDFVMGFSHEEDARRVLAVLPKRFAKYGLTIHPDKTRLVPFERPDHGPKPPDANRREPPGTFDLLGFTHFWARSLRGKLGGEAQDISQSIQPGAEVDIAMVPAQPASADGGSAPHTVPEAERSLRLLRNHRQLRCSVPIPLVCDPASGGNGSRGVAARGPFPGISSTGCWGGIRSHHRSRSTQCAVP